MEYPRHGIPFSCKKEQILIHSTTCVNPQRTMPSEKNTKPQSPQSLSRVQLFATPQAVAGQAPRPWDSPGKSTGVGCHFLLQGIFPNQGSNSGLPHCRQILYSLSHQGTPYLKVYYYKQNKTKQSYPPSPNLQTHVY